MPPALSARYCRVLPRQKKLVIQREVADTRYCEGGRLRWLSRTYLSGTAENRAHGPGGPWIDRRGAVDAC